MKPTLAPAREPFATRTKSPVRKPLALVTSALVWCVFGLRAQSGPTITNQPASQTVLAGTNVILMAAVDGIGPLTYHWQFNGTNLPNNIITTVAGKTSLGYSGDGGPATNASLNSPAGVALDAWGNLYIADTSNNRVRKVDPNGIITTVAGKTGPGYAGDGGSATNASLFDPYDVALDTAGNLYIDDYVNGRVRRVDTNGVITTVAGNGNYGYSGDGGSATNATLASPLTLGFDAAGDLYIADRGNNRIRKVDTNGIMTTVAGKTGATYSGDGGAATNASLYDPYDVASDTDGILFIADTFNNRVRKVDSDGIITTVAGKSGGGYSGDGGAATNANLNHPQGVTLDAVGALYVADYNNNRVRKVDPNGIITTVAGKGTVGYSGEGGAATNASLKGPSGLAFDAAGNLYIADSLNNRIRKLLLDATYPTLTLLNVSATNAGNYTVVITSPYGSVTSQVATLTVEAAAVITVQPAGQIVAAGSSPMFSVVVAGSGPFEYLWFFDSTNLVQSGTNSTLTLPGVSTNDAGNYTVVVTNSYGSVTSQVATLAIAFPPSVTTQPISQTNLAGTSVTFSVAADGTGPLTYEWQLNGSNLPNNVISTVAGTGTAAYAGDGGLATNASLDLPEGLAVDAVGNLYIADYENNRVRKLDTSGMITTVAGRSGGGNYSGDGGAATNATLAQPQALVFNPAGDLYIADRGNNLIRKVNTNGIINTVAGNTGAPFSGDGGAATNAGLGLLQGLALDAAGNLYISDSYNERIRRVDSSGIITTVAGNGTNAYAGDGGAATNGSLNYVSGLALDTAGNLYVADSNNNRVRKVDSSGFITTIAGNGYGKYGGDGGMATNASLFGPSGVAVDAAGNLYIADAKNHRIRKVLLYGTSQLLSLLNVDAANAGNYAVVISNPYGSVTSAVATLTVTVPRTQPQIITGDASFGAHSNHFGFNLSGPAGETIVVDGSIDLVGWTPLFTNTVVGSPFYFFDPASTNYPTRFYRARLL
jgi:sugar lactone lactonase YvrE